VRTVLVDPVQAQPLIADYLARQIRRLSKK
jgi:hypothetical protein